MIIFLFFILFISSCQCQFEGIYCGKKTCYEVLNVNRNDDKNTITRAYRKMARKYHPDRQKTVNARANAELEFRKIAQAYEILRNEEQRKEYDYMLDNPEEMYYHYYQFFKRKYAQKVDIRLVLILLISMVSAAQYYGQWSNYQEAINFLTKEPKYRIQAKEIAKNKALLFEDCKKKNKEMKRWTKEHIRKFDDNVIREVILTKMDIKPSHVKVGIFIKPTIKKIFWVQILLWPYYLVCWLAFWIRWAVIYWLLKREYSRDDKLCIMKRYMGASKTQWDDAEEDEKQYYLDLELWKWENFKKYKEDKEEEQRKKLADDNSAKRYRRFMKKGGPGQMVFGPEDVDVDF